MEVLQTNMEQRGKYR